MMDSQKWHQALILKQQRERLVLATGILVLCGLIGVTWLLLTEANHQRRERQAAHEYRDMIQEYIIVTMDVPQLILNADGVVDFQNIAAARIGMRAVGKRLLDVVEIQNPGPLKTLLAFPDESQSVKASIGFNGLSGNMRVQPRLIDGEWKFWVILQLAGGPEDSTTSLRDSLEYRAMVLESERLGT